MIHEITHIGAADRIVYFRPTKCINGPATRLPTNAPLGGIEPIYLHASLFQFPCYIKKNSMQNILAQEAMYLVGRRPGFISIILGTAGDEYPRTSPIQKYDMDTHSESIV